MWKSHPSVTLELEQAAVKRIPSSFGLETRKDDYIPSNGKVPTDISKWRRRQRAANLRVSAVVKVDPELLDA